MRAGMGPSLGASTLSSLPEPECTLLDIKIALAAIVRSEEYEKQVTCALGPPAQFLSASIGGKTTFQNTKQKQAYASASDGTMR